MSKTQTTLVLDDDLLREAERLARTRQTTVDELFEEALRREIQTGSTPARHSIDLPAFGRGGLLPGVDLEDKDQLDPLLTTP